MIYISALFALGAIVMRGAGCTYNDIVDRDYDGKVERSRNRPLPAGQISVKQAWVFLIVQCLIGLSVLLQFNLETIALGVLSLFPIAIYPFMKRFTWWPQLFLGIAFNWGALMGYAALTGNISSSAGMVYVAAIFWTVGYDTIYGAQDIIDDEIIGVKSTSIKFKSMLKKFVFLCYTTSCLVLLVFFYFNMNSVYFLFPLLGFSATLFYQIYIFDKRKPETCMQAFKVNNFSGFYLFLTFLTFSL